MEGIRVQTVISVPTQTHTGLYKPNNTKHYFLYILGYQNHDNNNHNYNNHNNNHETIIVVVSEFLHILWP